MSEGQIPVNAEDLPLETALLEESEVYTAEFTKFALAMKLDKQGGMYGAAQFVVTDTDYEGQTLMLNWLPLPTSVHPDASKRERIAAQNRSVTFGRFCKAFKITGRIPSVNLHDSDSMSAFQDWISQFYGNTGKITVRNQEFNGRLRSGVNDFLV